MGNITLPLWEIGAGLFLMCLIGAALAHYLWSPKTAGEQVAVQPSVLPVGGLAPLAGKVSLVAQLATTLLKRLQASNADGKHTPLIDVLRTVIHDELYALTGIDIGGPLGNPTPPASSSVLGGGTPPGK